MLPIAANVWGEIGSRLERHVQDQLDCAIFTLTPIEDGVGWFKAAGSIRMAEGLGWPWRAAVVFRALPRRLADWLYDHVAFNRIRWFGSRAKCYAPAPEDPGRFLS